MQISMHLRRDLLFLCISLLLVGLLLPPALAAEESVPAAPPLQSFLNSDGTLNVPAGFRGSLDARGWQLTSGPDEAPRFAPTGRSPTDRSLDRSPAARLLLAPDDHWDRSFSTQGTSGEVLSVAVDDSGVVYVGGYFGTAGWIPARNIARWDGSGWSALGSGMNDWVWALAVDGNGNVYAGGFFTYAGGIPANYIARWDGSAWSALDSGMNGTVNALALDGNGNLYAGGDFTTAGGVPANRIARWDGSAWSPLGSGIEGTGTSVYALAVDGNGNLYAGGVFTTAGGVPANRVARWDGAQWSALGSGVEDGQVSALALDGSGGLYAGGYFGTAGGVLVNDIAHWDGSDWSALGSGMNSYVEALAVDGSGNLYAGGAFTSAGGVPGTSYMARWDGSAWFGAPGGGVNMYVYALTVDDGVDLYAGGGFFTAGGGTVNHVARWDGAQWSGLGNGMTSQIYALAEDGSGTLYAGGAFVSAGGVLANCIARWDGAQWSALGSGMNGWVLALAGDGNGNVYAGGWFSTAGGAPASSIARWDGTQWSALGDGVNGTVNALAGGGSEDVYAGGLFTTAGGITVDYIARWDGAAWSALGSGMDGTVNALALDGSGILYAAGAFTTAGGIAANYIARWDGSQWSALGSGMDGAVNALALDGSGNLYAGGSFTSAGGVPASRVARWDGSNWSALGNGVDGTVYALALDDGGGVYAGGYFGTAGGVLVNDIARWDGAAWSALGSGMNSYVYALAVNGIENLYAGGTFTIAGNRFSLYIAHWFNPAPVANSDGYSTIEDTVLDVPAPGLLANDTDAHDDPLTAAVETPPPVGALALNPDGSFLYTPAPDYFGPVTFTYRLADPYGGVSTGAVSITVIAVDDAPRAGSDAYTTTEDTPLVVPAPGVLGNDVEADGQALLAALLVPPLTGTAVLYPDGALTYLPAPDWSGQDVLIYLVTDGTLIDTATVTIAVTGVNDAPVAQDDVYTTTEDTPLAVPAPGVLANDGDVDGDPLTAAVATPPAHGTLALNADGSFLYTPGLYWNGADSFIYLVSDGMLTDTATAQIVVTPINHAPAAADDGYSTLEDTPLAVFAPGVLDNDGDVDGDPLSALLVTPPAHGTLTLHADGAFLYAPDLDWNGSDSFTYAAADGELTATATVQLTVTAVNDAPVGRNDLYSTPQDTPLAVAAPGVLGNDEDVDGGALTAALYTPPAHGAVALSPDGALAYTPTQGFAGADSFTYLVSDGALTDTALVVIDVGGVDDPPIAQDDAYATAEDTPLVVAAPGVLENDLDPEGAPLTAALVDPPTEGMLALNADGSFTYTPELNWSGVVSFTYLASDGGLTATARVQLTVNAVNDPPVAVAEAYTAISGTALIVAAPGVLANDVDVDGDPLTAVLDTPPANGTLALNAAGSFVYTATLGFTGVVTFTYHADDGQAGSAPVEVTITVLAEPVDSWTVFLPVVFRRAGR